MTPPPQNREAERAALGSALITADAARWVLTNLEGKHFYEEKHRVVLEVMRKLNEEGEIIDLVAVIGRLRQADKLVFVGGPEYVLGLQRSVATAAHVDYYGREILRAFWDRSIINLSTAIVQSTREQNQVLRDKSLEDLREAGRQRDGLGNSHVVSIKDAVNRALDHLDSGPAKLIPTGIETVDRLIDGLGPGNLLVIAGRPGAGKTVAGLNIACNMARMGKKVGYMTGEMEAAEIVMRAVSAETGVPHHRLRSRKFKPGDVAEVVSGAPKLADWPLTFNEKPSPNLRDIKSFMASTQADCIFVDHLTRCELPPGEQYRHRVNEFMRLFKNELRESRKPGVLMVQMNRETDKSPDKRPTLSDLSESSGIEKEADFVILIHQSSEEKMKDVSEAEFCVAKARGTPVGICVVQWDKPTMRLGAKKYPDTPMIPEISHHVDRAKLAAHDVDDQDVPF